MTGSDRSGNDEPGSDGPGSHSPTSDWPSTDLVGHSAASTPAGTAIVDADRNREWTYEAVDTIVGDVAAGLVDSLPGDGGRVATLCGTRFATAVLLHGTMRTGSAAVPLNPSLPATAVAARLDRADADLLVCERDTEAAAIQAATAADCPVTSVDAPDDESIDSLRPGRTVAGPPRASLDREDEALVAFTSGTTGEPDGVRLTVGNLVASATASAFRLGTLPADRWLCCLPMHHLGGISPVYRSACYGTTLVVQRDFDADATASVIADYGVTGVSLVPTQLRRLLDADWTPPDSLRCVLLGGAPAGRDLVEDALADGIPVHPTYGATETASQIATALPEEVHERPETVGRPLQFTEVTVVADDGEALPAGERGELVVAGPTVTPGYLDEDTTADSVGEHGLHTRDLGYRDADGFIHVLGRLDDTIITGGETVHPAAVADALRDHPAVRDAAIVGLPDEEWGERVAALVEAANYPIGDLHEFASETLPDYAVPKEVAFAEALPRTDSGTVDREAVRDRLRDA